MWDYDSEDIGEILAGQRQYEEDKARRKKEWDLQEPARNKQELAKWEAVNTLMNKIRFYERSANVLLMVSSSKETVNKNKVQELNLMRLELWKLLDSSIKYISPLEDEFQ